jgi:hypothetical protein
LHVNGAVEIPCLSPQQYRLVHLRRALLEDGERSHCVREIEWRRTLVTPIECKRFLVARLGRFQATRILVDVTEMANHMCQLKNVTLATAQRDRFFVQGSGRFAAPKISFDLTQPLESSNQLAARASLATEEHGLHEISMGVAKTVLSSSEGSLLNELHSCV